MTERRPFRVSYHIIPAMVDTSNARTLADYNILANLGCGLIYLGDRDQYYAALAKRWEVDRPGNSITFELRPDAKFSDGTPLTADEVVYTFKRLAITGSYHFAVREILTGTENVKTMTDPFPGVVALDKTRVRFSFKKLGISALYLFTMADASIIHPCQVDLKTLTMINWSISSGAYYLQKSEPGYMRLQLNPYFPMRTSESIPTIELVEITEIDELIRKLNDGSLDYTMESYLSDQAYYKMLESGRRIEVASAQVYCATQLIRLLPTHPFFSDKKNRQAFYRWFVEGNHDLRPMKNQWFSPSFHLFLPTQYGRPSKLEVDRVIEQFTRTVKPASAYTRKSYKITYLPSMVSNGHTDEVVNLFKNFGLSCAYDSYTSREYWLSLLKNDFLFFICPLYIDEKDLHEAFTYMLKTGYYYRENSAKAAELNAKLLAAEDKKEQAEIIRQLGLLLTEDALVIPLYHIVRQDIMNKDYEYSAVNGFHSVPTLWRIRRKTP